MDKVRGFTIVELMVSLGVLAILVAIAMPRFDQMIRWNQADRFREDMYAELALARSEALARGRSVTVCAATDTNAGSESCSADDSDWQSGWIVFEDLDSDSTYDNGEPLISIYENPNIGQAQISYNNGDSIRFNRLGGTGNNGRFRFCDAAVGYEAGVILSPEGRPRYSNTEADGSDLGC